MPRTYKTVRAVSSRADPTGTIGTSISDVGTGSTEPVPGRMAPVEPKKKE